MKIFNFGNDYAYQQKQEQQAKQEFASKTDQHEIAKNAGDQIQTRGEREVDPNAETEKAVKPKSKTKKEDWKEAKEDHQKEG